MPRSTRLAYVPFLVLVTALGCGKKEAPPASPYTAPATTPAVSPVKVTDVELGRALDADKRVSDKTDTFKPADTIYVAVVTDGSSPGAKLAAHWTYQDGQVVKHDEIVLAPTGRTNTEFHIAKPGGWPAGDYKVEILLDGVPAGTKSFKVAG